MVNPEEIDLGDEDALGEDDVPDGGDAAELDADDSAADAAMPAAIMTGLATAADAEQQNYTGGPARASLHARLAALQPADDGGHTSAQSGLRTIHNPEDIELPDED